MVNFNDVLLQQSISGENPRMYLNGIIQMLYKGNHTDIILIKFRQTELYALTILGIYRTFTLDEVHKEFRNFVCDTAFAVLKPDYESQLNFYRAKIIRFSLNDIAEILQTTMESSPIYQYFLDKYIEQSEKLHIARRGENFYLYVWSEAYHETWRPFAQDDSSDQLMNAVKKMVTFELWGE